MLNKKCKFHIFADDMIIQVSRDEMAIAHGYIPEIILSRKLLINVCPKININIFELGKSYEIAKLRLFSLERRFQRNPNLKNNLTACLDDYLE